MKTPISVSPPLEHMLVGLDKPKRKAFRQYLLSPYFNRNPRLILLYDYFLSHQALPRDYRLCYELLFGTQKGQNKQQVYDHCAFLKKRLIAFLGQEESVQQHFFPKLHQLKGLRNASFKKGFKKLLNTLLKQRSKKPAYHADFFLESYLLHREGDLQFLSEQKRIQDEHLEQMVDNLDRFYLAAKLKHSCQMLNRQHVIQTRYQFPLLESLIPLIESNADLLQSPEIALYYHIFYCLREQQADHHFEQLQRLLKLHLAAFPSEEAAALISYAQNYCVRQINMGRNAFLRPYFELDQEMLQRNLHLQQGILDHRKYKNVLTVALRLKEFDWAENFLNQYRDKLAVAHQDAAYYYNLAAYYFEQKQFQAAQQQLWRVDVEDIYYELGKRVMLLKIYYELVDEDGLDAQVRAFRAFLKRNHQVSKYQKSLHAGLIRYTQQLSRLRNQKHKMSQADYQTALTKLQDAVQEQAELTNASWLFAQIEAEKLTG